MIDILENDVTGVKVTVTLTLYSSFFSVSIIIITVFNNSVMILLITDGKYELSFKRNIITIYGHLIHGDIKCW